MLLEYSNSRDTIPLNGKTTTSNLDLPAARSHDHKHDRICMIRNLKPRQQGERDRCDEIVTHCGGSTVSATCPTNLLPLWLLQNSQETAP